jgi:hypothetical protein
MNRVAVAISVLLAMMQPKTFTESTRGIGVYPGRPSEYAGPVLEIDSTTYRNVALRRPAYHSSSYDYNLTAQLVTDGVVSTEEPRWLAIRTSGEQALPKHSREWLVDGNWTTAIDLPGSSAWVSMELGGGATPLRVDRIEVEAHVRGKSGGQPENWTCTVAASPDGRSWTEVGQVSDMARPSGDINASIPVNPVADARLYRITFDNPRAAQWQVREVRFFDAGVQHRVGGPHHFTSAWMSAGSPTEWIQVDLGAPATIDRIVLHWITRGEDGDIQVSDDAASWRTVESLAQQHASPDDIRLPNVQCRYVRVLMTRPRTSPYFVLSEIEVHGRGGVVARPQPAAAPERGMRQELSRGIWRVQRESLIRTDASGAAISTESFRDDDWLPATVPGTVLTSYLNAGAIPDPNYGDNQLMISDSFFHADFWYRSQFAAPGRTEGKRVWLHFDGVNWNADVFLNGETVGRIEGAFKRARFDVTGRLRPAGANVLAVRVEKNATPGAVKEKTFESPDKNGGALGADSPTYLASIGWDWIPTIRGRNTGIWGAVSLRETGDVTLTDPIVTSTLPLPDVSSAAIRIQATLRNHTERPVAGKLTGRLGDIRFEAPVALPPLASTSVSFDPGTHPQLHVQNPRLWWPAGYGEPNLYDVELGFEAPDGSLSDSTAFRTGIRQFTTKVANDTLRIWINGRRFAPRGGNWGFPESMLRYRSREYEAAVRYHRDMNFNMIRNWVGQTGDDALYDAADRYGIVVWQDFWLANPWDGPDPSSDRVFLENALDTVRRIRTHPSVGLYCGRNEGYPPKPLDDALRRLVGEEHPDVTFISSSADDVVSGHGPYRAMPSAYYFKERATQKIHSEMGMPNVPTFDSVRQMMPESEMWPHGRVWGLHDFSLTGAQNAGAYIDRVRESFGAAQNAREWVWLAQFLNYEGYRAMFEAQSRHRMGLLLWMSHPAWPSFVWQTYDYYLDPSAAYFGSRKGSEPLHIQWNPLTDAIEVVNYSAGDKRGLIARAEVLNLDGAVRWKDSATVDSGEDSTTTALKAQFSQGLTPVHFLRLTLLDGERPLSENLYWRGVTEGDFRALREVPPVKLNVSTSSRHDASTWQLTTVLHNPTTSPALLVRVKVVRERTRDRILPALYSDNYVVLMPSERRTITTEVRVEDTRGERPAIVVEGFNVP